MTTLREKSDDTVDVVLLRQIAQNRDKHAMQTLYKSYQNRILPFLKRMTDDFELIEEIYNDVMVSVWNNAHQFKGDSKVSSWIFSIAYRSCLRMLKKAQMRERLYDAFSLFLLTANDDTDEPQEHPRSTEIEQAVKSLPAKQRLMVELSYFQGCSLQEISEIAKCPLNTVKTRLHHARNKIKLVLETTEMRAELHE